VEAHNVRSIPLLLALLALVAVCYFFHGTDGSSTRAADPYPFLGTWTEEAGEPGNSIRFSLVRAREVGTVMGVSAWNGRAEYRKHFGREQIVSVWNFADFEPIRLNVQPTPKVRLAAIRMLGPDRMLIRFGWDLETMFARDVFESPQTKVLVRTEAGRWEEPDEQD